MAEQDALTQVSGGGLVGDLDGAGTMRLRKDDLDDLMGHYSSQPQARCQFFQPHHAPFITILANSTETRGSLLEISPMIGLELPRGGFNETRRTASTWRDH